MPTPGNVKAGAAYIELYTKDSRLIKGLNAVQAKLRAFGAGITAIGTRLAALGGAVTTPLVATSKVFAEVGADLADMSQRTGVSVEALSELGFAAGQSGTDLATLEGSLRKMQKLLVAAGEGSTEATATLATLGLTIEELKTLAPDEQFARLADRIALVADPARRAVVAMALFGKSGAKLLPLMHDGARGIDALRQQARALGLTISTEDALAAREFGDTLDVLWKSLKRTAFTVGSALAPTLTEAAEIVTRVVQSSREWLAENKALIATVLKVASVALAAGTALIGLGSAVKLLSIGPSGIAAVATSAGAAASTVGTLASIFASLLSPIGLVIGGLGALAAYLVYATGAGGEALAWLGDQFNILKETALAAWKGVGDALAAGDLALAARIVWLTLKMEWQRGINFLEAKWLDFKGFFVGVWQGAVFSIARALTNAWAGLQVSWVQTITFLGNTWSRFIGLLQLGWNHFAGFFQRLWARIKSLFGETDAEAEIAKINAEVAQRDEAIRKGRDAAIEDRRQNRDAELATIERDRVGAQGALADMQATEQAQREARHQAALAESEKELAAARQEWQAALREAETKRAGADAKGPGRVAKPSVELPSPDELDALLNDTRKKIDVVGSFNPLAARGLGADSLSERTAKASEQVAANTKKLVQQAAHGGLVFG